MRAGSREILDWPLCRRRERHDMIPDPLCLGFEKRTGVLEQNPSPGQVAAERPIGEEAVEMPFEDHPVERVDHARDRLAMQIDETVHSCPVAVIHPIVRVEIPKSNPDDLGIAAFGCGPQAAL
jgi:hypothetical protein